MKQDKIIVSDTSYKSNNTFNVVFNIGKIHWTKNQQIM